MDLIDRQAAIKTLEKGLPSEPLKSKYTEGITVGFGLAITWIEQLPVVQPEIIHCKECIHKIKNGNHYECNYWDFEDPKDDGFCSFAERKQDDRH